MDKNFKILQDFDLNRNDILNVENIVGPKYYSGLSRDLNIFTEDLDTSTGNINIHTGENVESYSDNGIVTIASGNSNNNSEIKITSKNVDIKTRISNIGSNLKEQTNLFISSDRNIGGNIQITSFEQNVYSNYIKVSNFEQYALVTPQPAPGNPVSGLYYANGIQFTLCAEGEVAVDGRSYYKRYNDKTPDYIDYQLLDDTDARDIKVIDRLKVYPKELIIGNEDPNGSYQSNVKIFGDSNIDGERLELSSEDGGNIKVKTLKVSSDFEFSNDFKIYWDKDKNSLVFAKSSN